MRYLCLFFLLLLSGCQEWRFYVAADKDTRKHLSLDFRMGRVFAGDDAICVEVNLINWSKRKVRIPRSSIAMKSADQPLSIIPKNRAHLTSTFRRGVYRYYQAPNTKITLEQISAKLYAPRKLILTPRNTQQNYLVCYEIDKQHQGPFSLHLLGVKMRNQAVQMEPFRLQLLKPTDTAS
jgi:hypothetical protein